MIRDQIGREPLRTKTHEITVYLASIRQVTARNQDKRGV